MSVGDLSERIAALPPEKRALLAKKLRQKLDRTRSQIRPQPRDTNLFPLSFGQERLWFVQELVPDSPLYNVCVAMRVNGFYDVPGLEQMISHILERHEILRTTFTSIDGQPMQVIHPPQPCKLPVVNLEHLPTEEREAEITRLIAEQAALPFDLKTGPLIRFLLIQPAHEEFVMVITANHIICDGLTMGFFIQELVTILIAYFQNQPSPLPPLPLQYADYAVWQRQWLQGEVLEEQLSYWRERLSGDLPVLDLPTDRPRPPVQTFRGDRCSLMLPRELSDRVKALAQAEGATLFTTLLAAFNILLHYYTRQDDLIVGTPVVSRPQSELEQLIGFFVNTLPMRTDLSGNPTFSDVLAQVRQTTLDAFAHQHLPLEKLLDELNLDRDLSRFPLFQVAFVLLQDPMRQIDVPGYSFSIVKAYEGSYQIPTGATKYDLTLEMTEVEGVLAASIEYSTDLFDKSTILRMLDHYQLVLDQVAAHPKARLSELSLLSESERQQLLQWNATATDYPRQATVQRLFERQVEQLPDAIAVSFGERALSYAELNRRANQLAHYLRSHGVGPDVLVGLCVERSPELIVALLGILKAGGAYAPLDPSYPAERLAWMLEDIRPALLIVDRHLLASLPPFAGTVLCIDQFADLLADQPTSDPVDLVSAGHLAYVMYTSGSTGRPKGIMVPHRGIVRLVQATNYARFGPDEVFLLLAPISFDASTLEIWGPLLNGGRLVIFPPHLPSLAELSRTLVREKITTLWLTAGLFHQMVDHEIDGLRRLRQLLAGGDVLSVSHVQKVLRELPGCAMINGYGPTENTTFTCCHRVASAEEIATSVPIGRPIANTHVYILDRYDQLAPVGVPGELVIGGDGLAHGYLNRPDLTAERFVPDPFSGKAGARLYRTGDLARYRADGTIEFLGRRDQQVKIRGFRIELGEIETVLAQHELVQGAVVVIREESPGDKRLVGYVTLHQDVAIAPAELQRYLQARLPEYMVPGAIVILDSFPLTPNGKLDRRALPAPIQTRSDHEGTFAPPRTPLEIVLAEMWSELLDLPRVGIHDNFFALGGHSLVATQVVSRLRERLQIELPLRALFEGPTIAQLAERIEELRDMSAGATSSDASDLPLERVERTEDLPLSFAQQRLWFLDQLTPGSGVYNVPFAMRLRGPLDVACLERSLNEIVQRHEVLRTTFIKSGGVPRQVIHQHMPISLPVIELQHLSPAEREAEARRLAAETALAPFDLAAGPLIRGQVLKLDDDDWIVMVGMHHIVSDGWSLGVFAHEWSLLYEAFLMGRPSPLPPLPIQYADYAAWQRRWLQGEALARQLDYWRQQLVGAPTLLELPTDRPRPPVQTYNGGYASIPLPPDLVEELELLSQGEQVTLFMTLLAAFQTLLYRYSGQEDILVGSPIANRTRAELEGLIGFFVNTLVLRADLSGNPSFRQLLHRVRQTTLDAYAHQDVPFEMLVETIQPERALDHTPLFQVMFVLQNTPPSTPRFANLTTRPLEADAGVAKFDLTLEVRETSNGLVAVADYNADLFDKSTIIRMLGHFRTMLRAIVRDPDTGIADLELMDSTELQRVVREWNDTAVDYPEPGWIHQCFEAQAERTPDALAVVFEDQFLTYAQLNARANQLAHYLRTLGVGPETRVGVCLQRSPELLIALLAVLKAGGAYVPLDPSYPAERLAFMLSDARPAVVLTTHALAPQLPPSPARLLCLDLEAEAIAHQPASALARTLHPAQLAYIIYTSGSTGKPKGTLITQRGLSNYLLWAVQAYEAAAGAGAPVHSPLGFDLTVTSLYTPLLAGRPVVLVREAPGADGLREVLERAGPFSLVKLTPAHLDVLRASLPAQAAANARLLVIGGEALYGESLRWWRAQAPQIRLVNEYGPTETVVGCCVYEVPEGQPAGGAVPIGRPIANMRMYVLDAQLQPVPVGVVGELYIGGVGVGRGYLNRPDLTAERFVPEPWGGEPGARMYRTGDLGRWRADGVLEYLGRMDQQIKLRGFRIELGEIEATLAAHPAVREAVVVLHEDQTDSGYRHQRLVAYVVPTAGQTLDLGELTAFLQRSLPEYMLPATFIPLETLPLTANGKVDRRALPAPDGAQLSRQFIAPRTATEQQLAGIWAEVLHTDRIGLYENFFSLGGHSLLATQVIARIRDAFGAELPLRAIFEHPTLAGLAQQVDAALAGEESARPAPIPPARRDQPLPLSFAQQRLWFLDQLIPNNPAYNIAGAVHIAGPLNAEAWERALNAIVQRHEALRTTFVAGEGEPVQVISESLQLHLPLVSLEALPPDEREAQLRALVLTESQQPFDLARGPLIRGVLYRLGADEHVLFLSMHHIVSDGWSMGILIRELALLCQEFSGGEAARLTPLPIQYADYAAWQRAWFQSEDAARQLDYWRRQLAGAPTLLELPTDKPRPPVQSYRGATYNFRLPAELSQALAGLSQGEQATLFMTLLAAFQTLLYRYSGQEDILVGSPIANRTRAELEGLIGFFVNTLVLRADLSGNPSFRQLLRRVRQTTLDAYAHQDTPFERVVDELQPQRSTSHTPLFQVMFILQNTPMPAITTETVRIRPLELDGGAAKFDLTLAFEETPEGLRGSLEYASDLFEEATIRRMAMHYEMLLRAIVRSPDTGIADLELMDSTELQRVVREWNDTAVDYPEPGWIHQCFEAQAERTPDALAVVFEDQFLTYAQLNARANQLAHYLRTLGVGPETRVGVCLERSLELVVALLGILKAGGAYVPLDPSYPAERLAFMLHDAQVPVLLSHSTLGERLPAFAGHLLCLDRDWPAIAACSSANPDVRLDGDNLAYIIYTSGSTGTPKGAMNSHAAIRNRLLWMQQTYQLTSSDRVLQKTPFSFDVSVWEFFWPLMVGARLVVARPEGHRDSAYLIELIAREQVTTLHFVPSMLQLFLADPAVERCSSLRLMICSGEALSAALSQRVGERLPQVALHNLYGPTEAAVDVTAWPCASDGRSVPIGRPIANTQIYLLDRRLRPVPIGVPGELYIGGVQLARGYWNRPELTAERFIPDPFSAQAGARLYKTGDLARYLADGAIEYLGRLDHQIKLRGFRIELGEIEAALLRHPDIREAVVVAHQEHDGDARLIAYIVGEQGQMPAQHELMAFLKQTLPEYMVPAVFVPLEALPLSPNGKLDRRALPAPTLARPDLARPYVAPRSGMEQTLAAIWQELLGIEQVGIDDNFFDLGGHSLLLAQARNRLQTALGRPIAMIELFEYPTIRTLVQHLTQEDEEDAILARSDDRSEQRKASLQRRREQRRSRQLVDGGEDDDEPGYD